jgi:hypothetical protein
MAAESNREAAVTALAGRVAERDQIQANLLELDSSFGKRLLEGGSLAGTTKLRWDAASAELASVWATFTGYTEVVRRAGELLDRTRYPSPALLAQVNELLTGPAVQLSGPHVPLAERQLTAGAQAAERLTLTAAVQRMTAAFPQITEVVGAAEKVWNEISDRLEQVESVLGPALRQIEGMADEGLSAMLTAADTELRRFRALLARDPLALWHGDGVDITGLADLQRHAAAAAAQVAELVRLREDADRRIAETAAKVASAGACEADAMAVRAEAERKIAADQLSAAPAATLQLSTRLAGLAAMKTAARWHQLAAELDAIETDAAVAAAGWRDAGRAAQAQLDRRGELRGLLDAYQAKASRQGAAENIELAAVYQRARDLLWAAPCDLAAADNAVRQYQHAVLGLSGGTP